MRSQLGGATQWHGFELCHPSRKNATNDQSIDPALYSSFIAKAGAHQLYGTINEEWSAERLPQRIINKYATSRQEMYIFGFNHTSSTLHIHCNVIYKRQFCKL